MTRDYRPYSVGYNCNYDHRIKNTESLPAGTGCKFLECMIAHNGDFIAHSWHRRSPEPRYGYMVFRF